MTVGQLERRHIKKIVIDSDEEELTVTFEETTGHHPITDEALTVETTETIPLSDLHAAARKAMGTMVDELIGSVMSRLHVTRGKVKCGTCSGRCCNRIYTFVALYKADIDRMEERLTVGEINERVKWLNKNHAPDWNGVVAHLRTVEFKVEGEPDEDKACVFLGLDYRCTIYNHRPQVCRDYSGWDCSEHKEAPEATPKRQRLPVLM